MVTVIYQRIRPNHRSKQCKILGQRRSRVQGVVEGWALAGSKSIQTTRREFDNNLLQLQLCEGIDRPFTDPFRNCNSLSGQRRPYYLLWICSFRSHSNAIRIYVCSQSTREPYVLRVPGNAPRGIIGVQRIYQSLCKEYGKPGGKEKREKRDKQEKQEKQRKQRASSN
jgi:hypothetical protein